MQDTPPRSIFVLFSSHCSVHNHYDCIGGQCSRVRVFRFFAMCLCCFGTTLVFAVILDQKSLVVVRWLPHRGRRCVGASFVEFSLKTHFSVAMSWLCVITKLKSTTGVCRLRCRQRRCVEASLVDLSLKTHFSVAMISLCVNPQKSRKVNKKQKRYELPLPRARSSIFCSITCVSALFLLDQPVTIRLSGGLERHSRRHQTADRRGCAGAGPLR